MPAPSGTSEVVKPTCIHGQGRMPGMVEPRRSRKSVLTHDLRIDMERGTCLAPLLERDVWPVCVQVLPPRKLHGHSTEMM